MRRPVGISPDQGQLDGIVDLLAAYVADEVPRLGETYTWAIPAQVPVPWSNPSSQNLAEANFRLKRALAENWHLETSDRYELANWYVGQWGGIRKNKPATIQTFALQSEDELARAPLAGIATWSKILAMRNPSLYAIFDARVSASLNALQFLASGEPILFPDLVSRNKTVNAFQRWSREERVRREHYRVRKEHVYPSYMAVLHEVGRRLGNESPDQAEMVLFANAEVLAMRAMAEKAP
jgi:hypothetical protein